MKKTISDHNRLWIVCGASAVILTTTGLHTGSVKAADFNYGEVFGSLDTTITVGASVRVEDQDSAIIAVSNGGTANSNNYDDGNLNYEQGDITSLSARVNHELQANWRNLGVFARVQYFNDAAVNNTARTEISDEGVSIAGRDFDILDAYITADFDVGSTPVAVRVGSQVISWGESTFIFNGINSINPVDIARIRTAGAELRDALVPVPAIDVSVDLTDSLSIEGFYQFTWDNTELEPAGTYFSTNDFASPGGDRVFFGFGQPPVRDTAPLVPIGANPPIGTAIPRGPDQEARDDGQYGFALRYFAEELNNTEFGLYFLNYHSRTPLLSAQTGTLAGAAAGDYANTARFTVEYPEDISLYGASFNTELGTSGWSLGGEVSFRDDQPLQIDDVELLFAGLTPLAALSPAAAAFGQNQIGTFGFNERIEGFRRKDVWQAQATATKLFPPALGANSIVFVGEVGATLIPDLEDASELRYQADGTFTSGNPFFTAAGIQPATTPDDAFADDFSWGYRMLARATYNNAIGSVNLIPQIAFSHDVSGTTPQPLSNFIEDRMSLTASLGFSYLERFRGALSYTTFFGADEFDLRNDRDFASVSLSYSF